MHWQRSVSKHAFEIIFMMYVYLALFCFMHDSRHSSWFLLDAGEFPSAQIWMPVWSRRESKWVVVVCFYFGFSILWSETKNSSLGTCAWICFLWALCILLELMLQSVPSSYSWLRFHFSFPWLNDFSDFFPCLNDVSCVWEGRCDKMLQLSFLIACSSHHRAKILLWAVNTGHCCAQSK